MKLRRTVLAVLAPLALLACGCSHSSGGSSGNTSGLLVDPPNGSFLTATVGTAIIQTFTFTGFDTSSTVTAPQGAPAGLTFAQGAVQPDGVVATLSGTPTTAANGAFQIQIVRPNNKTQFFTYGFSVVVNNSPLSISPTTLPNGIAHVLYNQSLVVSNGIQPITWTVQAGTLPPGLALSSSTSASNAISGTPTTAGVYSFTIQVTDASSPAKVGTFSYTVTIN